MLHSLDWRQKDCTKQRKADEDKVEEDRAQTENAAAGACQLVLVTQAIELNLALLIVWQNSHWISNNLGKAVFRLDLEAS